MSSPPSSPQAIRAEPDSPPAQHDSLSTFTPVKRNPGNPLFLPSPSSTASPSPAKRPRLDFGRDRSSAEAGPSRIRGVPASARPRDSNGDRGRNDRPPAQEAPEDVLALFDDSDDDRSDHGLDRANLTIQHGTEEGGLNGNAMDPYSMGNGAGTLMGRDLGMDRAGSDNDADDRKGGEKKRRVMPKMDHER